jgi:hypothetical protein
MMTPKSSVFLGISCIAAIAGVGCIFELTSGSPDWGSTATTAILVASIPISIWAFLTAVKDAKSNL